MNYWKHFNQTSAFRDAVLTDVLSRLDMSVQGLIIEVGAAVNLTERTRVGSGWSTFHFAMHIAKAKNWKLVSCDTDEQGLSRLTKIITTKLPKSRFKAFSDQSTIDAALSMSHPSLLYLDGPEDPDYTLQHFESIQECLVLIDDFGTKGSLISEKYGNPHKLFEPINDFGSPHPMGLYYK